MNDILQANSPHPIVTKSQKIYDHYELIRSSVRWAKAELTRDAVLQSTDENEVENKRTELK